MPLRSVGALVLMLGLTMGWNTLHAELRHSDGPASYPPAIGELHPDFSAPDHEGQPFNLFEQRGKVVLLHLCTVWCTPCRSSAEVEADLIADINALIGAGNWVLIDALYQDTNANPSQQADAEAWRQILATPARTVHANGEVDSELHDLGEQLMSIPQFIVLDAEGRVTGVVEGFGGKITTQALIDLVINSVAPPVHVNGFENP